jgi:hypothetical protein
MLTDPRAKLILKFVVVWLLGIPILLWFCWDGILFIVLAAISLVILSIISLINPDAFSEWRIYSSIPDELYRAGSMIFALWSIPLVVLMFLNPDLDFVGKMALFGGLPCVAILIYDIAWILKSGKKTDFEVTSGMTLRLIAAIVFIGIIVMALVVGFRGPMFPQGSDIGPIIAGYTIGYLFVMILSYRKFIKKSKLS